MLKVGCFVVLWEMLISPAKNQSFQRKDINAWKRILSFQPKLPEVYVVVSAVTKLALIASTTSASEEHLQPVFLQVVIEVAPPEKLSIVQKLILRKVFKMFTSISIV